MKQLIILLALATMPFLSSCQTQTEHQASEQSNSNKSNDNDMKKRTLVAYFSCTGNTQQLAKTIAEVVNGDLYEIAPAQPYSDADLDWRDKKSRSTLEMNDKSSRPAISGKVQNMNEYDVVFVGFPIWWYIAPTIVNTFLESYDFSGKTVIPFFTSGSSGAGETDKYLQNSCSKETHWHPAKRFQPDADKAAIKEWVDELKL